MTDEAQEERVVSPGPMVYGNGLAGIIRAVYENGDVEGCLKILPSHSCQLVLGVCQRHLNIEGNDREGFRFVAANEHGEEILEEENGGDEEEELVDPNVPGDFREACKIISDLSQTDSALPQRQRWAREWLVTIGYEE